MYRNIPFTLFTVLLCMNLGSTASAQLSGKTFKPPTEGGETMTATTGADLVNSVMQSAGYDLVEGREYDFSEKTESIAIPNLVWSHLEEKGLIDESNRQNSAIAIPAFIKGPMEQDSLEGVEVYWLEKIAIPNLLAERLVLDSFEADVDSAIAIPNLIRSRLEEKGIVVVSGGKRDAVAIPAFIRSSESWDSLEGVEVVRMEKIAIPNLLTGPGN